MTEARQNQEGSRGRQIKEMVNGRGKATIKPDQGEREGEREERREKEQEAHLD